MSGCLAPIVHAITIRQPWAWSIIHAGKNIENRGLGVAGRFRKLAGRRIAIHASLNMGDAEYAEASAFMRGLGVKVPPIAELWFGGIIGVATIGEVVTASPSPWFVGPAGVKLSEARPIDFIPCRGWPGVFNLEQSGISPERHPALAASRLGVVARSGARAGA